MKIQAFTKTRIAVLALVALTLVSATTYAWLSQPLVRVASGNSMVCR